MKAEHEMILPPPLIIQLYRNSNWKSNNNEVPAQQIDQNEIPFLPNDNDNM